MIGMKYICIEREWKGTDKIALFKTNIKYS